MKIIIGLALGVLVSAWFWYPRNVPQYQHPYEITFQEVSTSDLAACQADENCMDIQSFDN
jgi:hypothetical protein